MRRLTVIVGLLLVVTLLVPVSCAKQAATPSPTSPSPPSPTSPGRMAVSAPPPTIIITPGEGAYKASAAETLPSAAEERMIVRNGDMSLIVKNVVDTRDGIAQLAVTLEGWVVSSWILGEGQEMRGSISIRVPDEKFDPALVEIILHLETLESGRRTVDAGIHELGHHKAYQKTGDIRLAEDLQPAHSEAMTYVAARIVEYAIAKRFDDELKEAVWY